jgi:thioesterase domain-containing protein
MMPAAQLETFLHKKIPLTVAMGVHVADCNDQCVVLTAPLASNRNHLQTAFGGSLHALATLSGYSLLWTSLGEPEAHIVVRDSSMQYERPVRGELRAVCRSPAWMEFTQFRRHYARKGRARITLEAVIEEDGEIAARFRGVFVAISSEGPQTARK